MSKVWTVYKKENKIEFPNGENAIGVHRMGLGEVEITHKKIIRYSSNGNINYTFYFRGDGEYQLGSSFAHKVRKPKNELEKFLLEKGITKFSLIFYLKSPKKISEEVYETCNDHWHGSSGTDVEYLHNGKQEFLEEHGGEPHPNNCYALTSLSRKWLIKNADFLIELNGHPNNRRTKWMIREIKIRNGFTDYQQIITILKQYI